MFLESTNSRFDVIGGRDRQVGTARQEYKEQSDDTVNVRVAIPLYSGGATSARTRQQRHLRAAARYELADIQRSVRENVTSSWSDLDATRARLEASRTRLEAAELASRGVRREQQFGQRSMIDVLNQEQERLSARVALAEAERDAMIAERVYAASIGQIAPLLGIEPEPKKGWDIIETITAPFQSGAPEAEAGEETEGVTRRATVLEDAPGPRRGLVARPQSFEPVDAQVATTPSSAAPAPAAPVEPTRRRGILYAITHPFGLGAEKDSAPEPAAEQPERRSGGLIDAILHPFGLFRRGAS